MAERFVTLRLRLIPDDELCDPKTLTEDFGGSYTKLVKWLIDEVELVEIVDDLVCNAEIVSVDPEF